MAKRKTKAPAPTPPAWGMRFFSELFLGEHHIPGEMKPWGLGWQVCKHSDMSTFDSDGLTRLVLLAHDHCIRVSVEGASSKYLRICIWQRTGRVGRGAQHHPTMEQALDQWREDHKPIPDVIQLRDPRCDLTYRVAGTETAARSTASICSRSCSGSMASGSAIGSGPGSRKRLRKPLPSSSRRSVRQRNSMKFLEHIYWGLALYRIERHFLSVSELRSRIVLYEAQQARSQQTFSRIQRAAADRAGAKKRRAVRIAVATS